MPGFIVPAVSVGMARLSGGMAIVATLIAATGAMAGVFVTKASTINSWRSKMVDTPRQQPPAPRPNPATATVSVEKQVPLPHMPPRPEGAIVEAAPLNLPENTIAEQEAGRAAVETSNDQLRAEQEAGAKAISRFNQR